MLWQVVIQGALYVALFGLFVGIAYGLLLIFRKITRSEANIGAITSLTATLGVIIAVTQVAGSADGAMKARARNLALAQMLIKAAHEPVFEARYKDTPPERVLIPASKGKELAPALRQILKGLEEIPIDQMPSAKSGVQIVAARNGVDAALEMIDKTGPEHNAIDMTVAWKLMFGADLALTFERERLYPRSRVGPFDLFVNVERADDARVEPVKPTTRAVQQ